MDQPQPELNPLVADEPPAIPKAPPIAVGKILGQSFGLYFRMLLPFLTITVVVLSPVLAWGIYVIVKLTSGGSLLEGIGGFDALNAYNKYSNWVSFVLQPIATGAIMYGVFQRLQGKQAPIGKCLATGFGRGPQLLGVGLLTGLFMILVVVGGGFAATIIGGILGSKVVGVVLLFVGIVIPLVAVFCMLYVAPPAAVAERCRAMDAITRSAKLTKGNRVRVLAVNLVVFIPSFSVALVVFVYMMMGGFDTLSGALLLASNMPWIIALELGASVLFLALTSVAAAVTYYHLKIAVEGADPKELAAVFD